MNMVKVGWIFYGALLHRCPVSHFQYIQISLAPNTPTRSLISLHLLLLKLFHTTTNVIWSPLLSITLINFTQRPAHAAAGVPSRDLISEEWWISPICPDWSLHSHLWQIKWNSSIPVINSGHRTVGQARTQWEHTGTGACDSSFCLFQSSEESEYDNSLCARSMD